MRNKSQQELLRNFFVAPVNQTSRERIFFNRLAFDLKIAGARAGYHLHMYEPDVDRDGFDIVVEDEDTSRHFQTKAVVSSVGTQSWDIVAGFLWPNELSISKYGRDLVESGRGGGVILIEIDDSTDEGRVVYSYTDYEIIEAISQGFLLEDKPISPIGRPRTPARTEAADTIAKLWAAPRSQKLPISRKLFVRIAGPDYLLNIMGMRSMGEYASFAIKDAYGVVKVDANGKSEGGSPPNPISALAYHIGLLVAAQASDKVESRSTYFRGFEWVK